MLRRIVTAAVLIPIVVALIWYGSEIVVAVVAAVVAILALIELFALGERHGLRAFRKWTIACTVLVFYSQYSTGLIQTRHVSQQVSIVRNVTGGHLMVVDVFLIFLFGCVFIGIATQRGLQEVLPALAISAAGLNFIVVPFSFIVRVNEITDIGRYLVLFTLVLIWVGDMAAYFVGRSIGRFPMARVLSPKKTWEGSVANLIASLLVAFVFAKWLGLNLTMYLIIAAAANIAGQAGDLIESTYKRGAGVKDSGGILPGHGGMLDRIDSLILASPVVWAFYQWLTSARF